ncbi:YjbF family lipoprotein [Aeromonas media]|uniref:YjbF family lipoprotein n=1 Tax=Aeromonas media TaxID=651 RepID=A0AAP6L1Z5_AERME|nr:YjbF family lipoprotein [Aeromonas media]MDX7920843.1 YjbF family lipoprotein [Aeromonas media]
MLTKRIFIVLSILLFGCADNNFDSYQQLKFLFSGDEEITISPEAINKLPYASAFVTVDDRPRIFVVLAFAENNRLSWVSSDRGMIVTKHGRITRTLKLDNDLDYFADSMTDPLSQSSITSGAQFSYSVEWAKNRRSGRSLHSVFRQLADEDLDINGTVIVTSLYEETVQSIKDGQTWKNYYWLDKKSGLVRKTIQKLGPDNSTIEMVFTKPYAP